MLATDVAARGLGQSNLALCYGRYISPKLFSSWQQRRQSNKQQGLPGSLQAWCCLTLPLPLLNWSQISWREGQGGIKSMQPAFELLVLRFSDKGHGVTICGCPPVYV